MLSDEVKEITNEKCECLRKPTYEELENERDRLLFQLRENDKLIYALEKALKIFAEQESEKKRENDYWKDENYNLRTRLKKYEKIVEELQPRIKLNEGVVNGLAVYFIESSGFVLEKEADAWKQFFDIKKK